MVHLEIGDGLLSLAKMLSIFGSLGIYLTLYGALESSG